MNRYHKNKFGLLFPETFQYWVNVVKCIINFLPHLGTCKIEKNKIIKKKTIKFFKKKHIWLEKLQKKI